MEIHRDYSKRKEYQTLLVSCPINVGGDLDQLQADTLQFMRQRSWNLAVFSDPLAKTRLMLESEGVKPFSYPTTIIVDREGVVRGLWAGYGKKNDNEMRAVLDRLFEPLE